jgi:hypothetical protein
MIITDSQSVSFGLLVMYVEDMYSAALGSINPPADPRIAASGWSIVDYLTAQDVLIPAKGAPDQKLSINGAKTPQPLSASLSFDAAGFGHGVPIARDASAQFRYKWGQKSAA